MSNYFSNDFTISPTAALIANNLVFFFSMLSILYLALFVISVAKAQYLLRHQRIMLISGYIAAFMALTPLVVKDITKQERVYAIEFGIGGIVYFAVLLMFAIFIGFSLFHGWRTHRGTDKQRVKSITYSIGATLLLIAVFNVLLPLSGKFTFTNLGPLASIILVFGLSYSIIRYRLFNIRLVVARSLAYLLSLGLLGVIYATFSFFVVNRILLDGESTTHLQEIVFTALALILALSFAPIRRYFNKVSNRLFYRDAYEPELFISEINRVVVANVDVGLLLEQVTTTISLHLKTQFAVFDLRETAYVKRRIIGKMEKEYNTADIEELEKNIMPLHQRVVVSDDIQESSYELHKILQSHDIAVVVRLAPSIKYDVEGFGLLLLGPKKSGNPYSKQDINVIRIIAGELAIAIQNALRYEEIEKFNITLQDKVDDATKKLRTTNDKLKAMDETKDEFISMASHQLRTPLTSVKGYLSMVLEGDAGELNDMQKKLLDQAFISSQRMVYLIADLLNVSRLRTGKFIIDAHPSDLAEVIKGEVDQLLDTAHARELQMIYEKPKDFPILNLDETKLRQVIMNFMDNAIYYTPSGGKIEVKLSETNESIEFTVNDNGMGVPKDEQHNLFNKFFRAGNAKKARPDGTGLGLFMAKKVIVAQGGSLIFSSREGKGSTFGFSFAKSKLALPAGVRE